jgi:SnoaL-like protein
MPHPFRAAVEARDLDAIAATLAPDAVLHSPVTFKPFEGRPAVMTLLTAVFQTFEDFHYVDELSGPGVHGLVFRARVGDREVEGIDLLRDDEAGRVADITVMVRPLSAAMALGEAVGRRLGVRA